MKYIKFHKSDIKLLNGFLPVNKPRGICCNKLMYLLRCDLNFVLGKQDIKHGPIEIFYTRALEPFASGLITYTFGHSNYYRRNFAFADYHHKAVVEFGVERQSHCIDGPVLNRSITTHLNEENIQTALNSFRGIFLQTKCKTIGDSIGNLGLSEKLATCNGIYDLVDMKEIKKTPKNAQKYPCALNLKEVNCQSIKLLEFHEPFATIEIISKGGINVRQLAHDLGAKLGTKASVIEMSRYKEGPISLNDQRVTQIHETQLEYYMHKMPLMQKGYREYTSQFDHLFESVSGYRPLI